MTIQPINVGNSPNDGTGDTLRVAFQKAMANDTDLDTRVQAMATILAATVQTPTAQKAMLTALVAALPTTLPSTSGVLWRNGQILAIS